MTRSTTPARKQPVLRKILIAAIWIGVWYAIFGIVQQEILIVSPDQVLVRLASLAFQGDFWTATLLSLARIVIGFLLAVGIGGLLAVLCYASSFMYDLFYPVIRIIRATPVASFIILALIWLNTDNVPIFASFLMVFPIIWENVFKGIENTSPNLLDMAKVFGLKKRTVLRKIYVPSVMPYFIAACNSGVGLAWKAGIAAEILGVPLHSIGSELYHAKIYLETIDVFVWTTVVIILSIVLEKVFLKLLKKAGDQYNVQE
jgi:NitT/TauT family transport system permease protein